MKPRTITAEREAEIRARGPQTNFHYPSTRLDLLAELDAERTAHSQTIQAAEKLAEALEVALQVIHSTEHVKYVHAALAQYASLRSEK